MARMKESITNEVIYRKLLEIETLLNKKTAHKRFDKLSDWKLYIWDGCPHKDETVKHNEILYNCNLRNGSCEFTVCPRNWIK